MCLRMLNILTCVFTVRVCLSVYYDLSPKNITLIYVIIRKKYSRVTIDIIFSDKTSPPNIKLKLKEDRRELRNQTTNVGPKIESLDKTQTFQTCAALVYNNLPKKIRENYNLNIFKQETKTFLLDRAIAHNFETL